ncbi:MAG TPA: hypothetical protein VGZ22_16065 [Isosphaeraceae bacterium]|jgi:hypothetical protein|nr:hypothetical protein [Isosphaeraceae bacterium]
MVRQRSVVSVALAAFIATIALAAQAPNAGKDPKDKAAGKTADSKSPAPAKDAAKKADAKDKDKAAASSDSKKEQVKKPKEPIDRRPYKIRAWVAVEQGVRIDEQGRLALIAAWERLVKRFVGMPWRIEVADGRGPLGEKTIDDLDATVIAPMVTDYDKAWMIVAEPASSGFTIRGREYDVQTGGLGPACSRPAPYQADAARALFSLSLDLFEPSAEIGEQSGGGVSITVRGGSLAAASPVGQIIKPGSVFKALRVFQRPDGSVTSIETVRRTYLRIKSLDGPVAYCDIVSSLRDPFTRRTTRKLTYLALGVKPASIPTKFRYQWAADKKPVAGYMLTCKSVPDGSLRELMMTDREGRVSLAPGFADGLVIFRLLAGNIEPFDEFPAMPGETLTEKTILIRGNLETIALETELNALRDELIDLVAVRARIESRLKARAEGNKWDEVEELLKEYGKLVPREEYVNRLNKLKDDATQRQAETKQAILTKSAIAQLQDTQALIDRYLDDEIFQAYARGLAEAKGEVTKDAAATKRAVAKKGTPPGARPAAPVGSAPGKAGSPPGARPPTTTASAPPGAAPQPQPAAPAQAPAPRPAPPPRPVSQAQPF